MILRSGTKDLRWGRRTNKEQEDYQQRLSNQQLSMHISAGLFMSFSANCQRPWSRYQQKIIVQYQNLWASSIKRRIQSSRNFGGAGWHKYCSQ
ncbi:hypothetical protein MKX03_033761 [Papaver bracteatum]|nr:hypothetical protein MKX03_033761 [Papaver bracteatum]